MHGGGTNQQQTGTANYRSARDQITWAACLCARGPVQMNMAASLKSSCAYMVLLLVSVAIPSLHFFLTDQAIEHTRMGAGLLPAHTLLLRWLGELSCILPILIIVCLLMSFRREWFTRASTLPRVVLVISKVQLAK